MNAHENIEEKQKLIQVQNSFKSKGKIIAIGLSASISALMFGYSLKEISSIPIQTIINNYDFTMDSNLLQGILISILPFGGLFGSLIARLFLKSISRIKGMHCALLFLVISLIIVQITTPLSLLIGRFMEGICIGYYVSIAPVYLKEFSPKELKSITGTFFSLGKILGIVLVVIIELNVGQAGWRFILAITGVLGLIQSILLAVIGVDTPYEWLLRQNQERALKAIEQIYRKECLESILYEIKTDIKIEQKNSEISQYTSEASQRKKTSAYYTALNVCIIRHFCGGNSLITSAGIIIANYNQQLSKWTPLTINLIQLLVLICYIFFFSNTIGKRILLVSSTYILTIINLMLVFSFISKEQYFIFATIIVFMLVYGGLFLSAVWSYPSEILAPEKSLIPNIMNWIALSISTLLPSVVMSIMPNDQVYPCFIFFFVYTLLTAIHFHRNIVQSNGRTYNQIINEFKEW